MAIVKFDAKRVFVVDPNGVCRIGRGSRSTIFPTIQSTIDDWRLDGMTDADWFSYDWRAEDGTADKPKRAVTIQGLSNASDKERAENSGYNPAEELERLDNLQRYIDNGFAFERPADSGDSFDDFDATLQCEDVYDENQESELQISENSAA